MIATITPLSDLVHDIVSALQAKTHRRTSPHPRLIQITSLLCLLLSLCLTLLSLLLPTRNARLPALTIKPIGRQWTASSLRPAGIPTTIFVDVDGYADPGPTSSARWLHRREPENSDVDAVVPDNRTMLWYGLDGAHIWLGPMRKVTTNILNAVSDG